MFNELINMFFGILCVLLIFYVVACVLWAIINTIIKNDKETKLELSDKVERKVLFAITISLIIFSCIAEALEFEIFTIWEVI